MEITVLQQNKMDVSFTITRLEYIRFVSFILFSAFSVAACFYAVCLLEIYRYNAREGVRYYL